MKHKACCVFPPDMDGVINVTKAPYFLDNTGKKDCTGPLTELIDSLMRLQAADMRQAWDRLNGMTEDIDRTFGNRRVNGKVIAVYPDELRQMPVIYFPKGVYLLTDTVSYSVRDLHNMIYWLSVEGNELNRCIRFLGEDRDNTVLKLQDHCKGFEYGQERPVISFMQSDQSNVAMSNYFENLTVDVGAGNPGAVALKFFANNSGAVRNVALRSSDPAGDGAVGLLIRGEFASGCFVRSLEVEGFSCGIRVEPSRNYAAFEDVRLLNPKKYGIEVRQTVTSVHGLESIGNVPAVFLSGAGAHLVLTDARMKADHSRYPAIKVNLGCVFLRSVFTEGFANAYDKNTGRITLPDGYIGEYTSRPGYELSGGTAKSLDLPVTPMPEFPEGCSLPFTVCTEAAGNGETDDTQAIQKAMDSGKEEIWLRPGHYRITGTVVIPPTVRHIHFMYCDIVTDGSFRGDSIFEIRGDSRDALFIEKLFTWDLCTGRFCMFLQTGTRTVCFRDMHTQACAFYRNTVGGSELFFENTACTIGSIRDDHDIPGFAFVGQTVRAWALDPERSDFGVINDGGSFWMLGFKTENCGTVVHTLHSGKTEILGGIVSVGHGKNEPVLLNDRSSVSAVFSTNGLGDESNFPLVVLEKENGESRTLTQEQMPQRIPPFFFCPLYSGRIRNETGHDC